MDDASRVGGTCALCRAACDRRRNVILRRRPTSPTSTITAYRGQASELRRSPRALSFTIVIRIAVAAALRKCASRPPSADRSCADKRVAHRATSMRALSNLRWWRCQSGNPPNSLCVRRTRTPLKLGPRPAYDCPGPNFYALQRTPWAGGSRRCTSRGFRSGVVIAVLLSGNAIAGGLEDCAAAYNRQDYAEAVRLCRPLAECGDARAQTSLGGMYYNGQGVQRDYAEAAKWVRKAAERGYARRRPTSASCTGTAKACRRTLF